MDTVKGLGILSVVVGHESRGLASSHLLEWTPAIRLADMWIYSFHMPLFFFLSGLFLLQSATKFSLRDFVSDKIRTLAYPYFVWSIITVVLEQHIGQIPNHPRNLSDLLIIPYEPIEQFWFLYALFSSSYSSWNTIRARSEALDFCVWR